MRSVKLSSIIKIDFRKVMLVEIKAGKVEASGLIRLRNTVPPGWFVRHIFGRQDLPEKALCNPSLLLQNSLTLLVILAQYGSDVIKICRTCILCSGTECVSGHAQDEPIVPITNTLSLPSVEIDRVIHDEMTGPLSH